VSIAEKTPDRLMPPICFLQALPLGGSQEQTMSGSSICRQLGTANVSAAPADLRSQSCR
jgi:hypothetical protein